MSEKISLDSSANKTLIGTDICSESATPVFGWLIF